MNNISLYICHIIFIYSAQWTLRLFCILAVVKSAVINMECRYLFDIWLSFPLVHTQKRVLLGQMVIVFLFFLRALPTFLYVAETVYIPTNTRVIFSTHTLTTFVICCLWFVAIQTGVRWYLIVVLIWISLNMWKDVQHQSRS